MAFRRSPALGVACLAALGVSAVGPASAQERSASSRDVRGVLELFTSQNCGDCPPVGAAAARLGAAPDLVVLAYHVDYWDYAGPKDQLADRRNTDRQKSYAKRLKLGALVTPQVVVNGQKAVDGGDEAALAKALKDAPFGCAKLGGEVVMRTQGDTLRIEARAPGADPARPAPILVLVTYAERVETTMPDEGNGGTRRVDHHPVRDWRVLGSVDRDAIEVEMPLGLLTENDGERTGLAALLQAVGADNKPGPIIAAAALEF
ncbi:DUF1223 domain-containing protein [Aureimonas phyllosphaerae]|uniref:DUF1223 domain-containing protein n=1 Tax=Aureimonas phyllosphaerae TaxID=1166078 RepID=A0A7W6FSU7_9HYPH|nr:DUF1223 domain-containing protein [Aureimonas phyllosphaerae]MBB3934035.1 hypothetical protein [Aureimonas phyllosphaerae]MBB3958749.1 hypothetical protein [Aureimonas phyllosphaerae]SFF18764.1 hypothetical protein SAMN05216566_10493 [Aureimonas phyllosphaerae]